MKHHGNKTVDAIARINLEGNIIPSNWYKSLVFDSGKPDLVSIIILADIVYWHRPTEIRDEYTGQVVEYRKKFKADLLQRSYESYADLLGISKRQARESIIRMEEKGILRRVFRTIPTPSGPISNVLFVKLNPEAIKQLTFHGVPYDISMSHPPHSNVTPPTSESHTYTEITTEVSTETYQTEQPVEQPVKTETKRAAMNKKISLAYQQNITHNIGSRTADIFNGWEIDCGGNLELILYAIERTAERVPHDGYKSKERFVTMLLAAWSNQNIQTREQAEAFENKPKETKKPAANKPAQGSRYKAIAEQQKG